MYHQRQKTENHIHMHCQKGTDQRNKKMAEQNRNYGQIKEITMHFGKGTVEPFTAKDGREMLKIVIPNADRSDYTP